MNKSFRIITVKRIQILNNRKYYVYMLIKTYNNISSIHFYIDVIYDVCI